MPHLFCSLVRELGFIPGTSAYPYLSSSVSVLNHGIARGRSCLWCHVCVLEWEQMGSWLSPWLDLLPAKGQNWLQRIWQKEERKTGWSHPLSATNYFVIFVRFCLNWDFRGLCKCYAIFRLRAKVWMTQLLSHWHRVIAWWPGSMQYLVHSVQTISVQKLSLFCT